MGASVGDPGRGGRSLARGLYRRAPDWVRARVTRWIAEQAAEEEASQEVRDRARDFLRARVAGADPGTDKAELGAMSWSASSTDLPDDVLTTIILPALEKAGGRTENEQGATEFVERTSMICPGCTRALHLLVDGDEWRSLPHVAAEPLRRALDTLWDPRILRHAPRPRQPSTSLAPKASWGIVIRLPQAISRLMSPDPKRGLLQTPTEPMLGPIRGPDRVSRRRLGPRSGLQ